MLPRKIILVRHAESEGNVDNFAYTYVPDMKVPLVRCQSLVTMHHVSYCLRKPFTAGTCTNIECMPL